MSDNLQKAYREESIKKTKEFEQIQACGTVEGKGGEERNRKEGTGSPF